MAAIWHGGKAPLEEMNASHDRTMMGAIGIELTEFGDDWVRGKMPVDKRTHQPFGLLHGGASVALAETLASVGAFSTVDPETHAAVGMEINANHVRPVREGWVYGEARIESRGRTTQVWTIRITNEKGKLVCLSRCTMAIVRTGTLKD
ncbi:hotdog fold thioesterase [Hyphobacterium sp. HN65]|uniref:Hotdog fold thioesterase n=1 Tax=Hyphobacterium lacteum TaxID=3116575 RepID=A0ABU7LRS3_9PROT|nr:hotdog fold thioesterase [Hyphobacterium sp. HN65]MEE2526611.1 hotdog fold thioesterase [Hyphobacterium sp. HN65]